MKITILISLLSLLIIPSLISGGGGAEQQQRRKSSKHQKNAAVIVSTSRFHHNYRHAVNALSMRKVLIDHGGYDDSNIVLMIAGDIPCDPRSATGRGSILRDGVDLLNSSGGGGDDDGIFTALSSTIDYAGDDVTVANFREVMLGRHHHRDEPLHRRLVTDSSTNLIVYLTGHGGDGFLKFQDQTEITTSDVAQILLEMDALKRYHEILIISDTCQAFTIFPNGDSGSESEFLPNHRHQLGSVRGVYGIGSSLKDKNSYSHHHNRELGISVIDQYVYRFLQYMDGDGMNNSNGRQHHRWDDMHRISLKKVLVDSMKNMLRENVGFTDVGCERKIEKVPMSDFFLVRKSDATFLTTNGNIEVTPSMVEEVEAETRRIMTSTGEVAAIMAAERKRKQKRWHQETDSPLPPPPQTKSLALSDPSFLSALTAFVVLVRYLCRD